ncbi:hypothetical protein EJ06DRAFT_526779 [Trichodelitschia bisporula]|uniref:Uncharacterized protein n=1 Tax=Trichodelitschia bisporula TaxID=703511 RepID=A0A6G1I952_9PEZI|nr:hypothetical protein EJ06DRAFT_526779 [Trichodelitschia bisporula]
MSTPSRSSTPHRSYLTLRVHMSGTRSPIASITPRPFARTPLGTQAFHPANQPTTPARGSASGHAPPASAFELPSPASSLGQTRERRESGGSNCGTTSRLCAASC